MMNPKSKQQRIKEYLKRGHILTPRGAVTMFNCYRLAAVVFRLKREQGMNIKNIGEHNYAEYQYKP